MKNGIYKVKPWGDLLGICEPGTEIDDPMIIVWTSFMEHSCPKSRQIRIFNDKWNISGEEFPVCPQMFEDGLI
jgi:hypothetical protein